MKKWNWILLLLQGLVYVLCVVDGICMVQGLTFLGTLWGNILTGLFFALLAVRLLIICRSRDRQALRRFRNYILGVLCASLALLTVWLLLWKGSRLAYEAALYLLLLVAVPLPSCSVLLLPILAWALLLVSGWMLLRRWDKA